MTAEFSACLLCRQAALTNLQTAHLAEGDKWNLLCQCSKGLRERDIYISASVVFSL